MATSVSMIRKTRWFCVPGVFRRLLALAGCITFAVAPGVSFGSDAEAMATIFNDEYLENVLALRERTIASPAEGAYELLKEAVLPVNRDVVRVPIDFAPTNPAPPVVDQLGLDPYWKQFDQTDGLRRVDIGGNLLSPALDLVRLAKELEKLPELSEIVESRAENKSQIALRLLLAIAAEEFKLAESLLVEFDKLISEEPVLRAERGPEAVVLWTVIQYPQLMEPSREIVFLVHQQIRDKLGPRSERWHRQVTALRYFLEWKTGLGIDPIPSNFGAPPEWVPIPRMTHYTAGSGFPWGAWATSRGVAAHLSSHDHEYLAYISPLAGEFTIEGNLTTFDFREIQLAIGDRWAGPSYTRDTCINGSFRDDLPTIRIKPALTETQRTMHAVGTVAQGLRTNSVNGHTLLSAPYPRTDSPWVGLHTAWYVRGTAEDVRITGAPRIPDRLSLLDSPDLPGWLPYFEDSAGGLGATWTLETP
ncbi:MAG: DUF1581 domain-containing protein, partial [Planctomycetaceae bacterium]|nr:DUF1581 domain-containing protein [Planctomycetaceae bacterium]